MTNLNVVGNRQKRQKASNRNGILHRMSFAETMGCELYLNTTALKQLSWTVVIDNDDWRKKIRT